MAKSLLPGDQAPSFKAKAALWKGDDIEEVEINMEVYKGSYLILMFYPQVRRKSVNEKDFVAHFDSVSAEEVKLKKL